MVLLPLTRGHSCHVHIGVLQQAPASHVTVTAAVQARQAASRAHIFVITCSLPSGVAATHVGPTAQPQRRSCAAAASPPLLPRPPLRAVGGMPTLDLQLLRSFLTSAPHKSKVRRATCARRDDHTPPGTHSKAAGQPPCTGSVATQLENCTIYVSYIASSTPLQPANNPTLASRMAPAKLRQRARG